MMLKQFSNFTLMGIERNLTNTIENDKGLKGISPNYKDTIKIYLGTCILINYIFMRSSGTLKFL